jgi:hypothetical protein
MSVTTVSFHESTLPSETYIASLGDSGGPPFTVHGVALGAGDVTKGASGIKKKWPADELAEAADSLEGTNLVVDHENNADGVVGTVTKAGYKEGTGVVYQADLYEEELAEKIENDLLEVSIRGYHADVENLEEDDETGALIVKDITFDNLSIVPTGAAPSNTLNMGSHEELTFAELQSFTASLVEDPEPGMWVQVDDMHGITISQVQNGEIEVDIYQESDGQWRSTGETRMVNTDDLESWDVEESDIGEVKDESDSSGEEAAACLEHVATLMGEMSIPMPGDAQLLYPSEAKAEKAAEMMNMDGIHSHQYEGEEWYMPGKNHEVFVERMSGMSSEENEPLIEEGMTFFSTVNNSEIVVKSVDGNIALVGTVEGNSQWKEEIENIINKLADGDWEHSGHMEEMIDTPDWSEGEMVQWQVMPEMKGKIVHNPEDEPYVMVEVMENGEPSGYTLTAGYTDIVEMESDEMAEQQFTRGDWVNWDTRNSTEIGKVIGGYTKGDDMPDFRGSRGLSPEEGEILYALRMYKERDGAFHPIEGKPIGHYEDSVRSAEEPANVSESSVELGRSNHEQYDVEEEEWVQWYPSEMTEEHGFVLDVDESAGGEDETIVTIEVWTQNSDGEWETDGEEITKAMELVEPWGNFPRKQEEFADAISGEDPRRAVKPGEEENTSDELISEEVEQALRDKAEKHNEEHAEDDDESKRVTYRMLKNVFERGMGAYQDSHREGMTPQQWSYARVNAFLYLVRNGNPENDAYTQDNDLLPEEHPKYNETGDSEENALTTADVIVEEVFGRHDPMGSDEEETPEEIVEKAVMAELAVDQDELDEVYAEWSDSVNMTAGELREWSAHPCSREASLAPVEVMKRNLELLEADKSDWDEGHIEDAKRTISFIARMRGADTPDKHGGPHGCPSKRDISLLNWAYNPFDEIPDVPDDEDLDSVSEVELARTVPSEEDYIETLRDRIRMMRNEPERFTRQQTNRAAEDIRGDIYGAQVDGLSTNEGETHSGEASDVASLAEFEMHEVDYLEGEGHEDEWNSPDLEDFVKEMGIDDDISEYDDLTEQAQEDVASAFILSASGFPAENFGDLKLPVVEPSGELSVRALAAVKGGRGASAVDGLSEEMEDKVIDYVNQLANGEFDRSWSEEENMPKHYGEDDETDENMGGDVPDDHMFETRSEAEDMAEDMGIEGAHQMGDMFVPGSSHEMYMEAVEEMNAPEDSVMVALPVQTDTNKITITNMSDLQEELEALDSPVAVEADELEALEQKADRLDTMSESLEELRERTEVLDEVDQSDLDELRGADDPMIVEAAEYEELSAEAEDVKNVYAASLAEEYDAFDADELTDRYSIEELRSKFEDTIGDVEEELTATSEAAEPRSQDVSEEQMTQTSEDELADEVAEKQAEIRDKILSK